MGKDGGRPEKRICHGYQNGDSYFQKLQKWPGRMKSVET